MTDLYAVISFQIFRDRTCSNHMLALCFLFTEFHIKNFLMSNVLTLNPL